MEKTRLTTISLFVLSQTDLADERMQYNFLRLDLHFEIYLVFFVESFTPLLKKNFFFFLVLIFHYY